MKRSLSPKSVSSSLVALALLMAAGIAGPARADRVATTTSATAPQQVQIQSDFNGDGYDDMAVSAFGYEVDGVISAGAVSVIYGSAAGLTKLGNQLWTENSPGLGMVAEDGDLWGRALAAADFNADGFADLAVGDGNKDVGGSVDAGVATVIYGSPNGLDASAGPGAQVWSQDSPDIQDQPEFDDNFGRAVYGGDFNADGYDDLAVGVAYEDIGTIQAAGAVAVIYGSPSGVNALAGPGNQFWSQDSPGIQEESQVQDRLGWNMTSADWNQDGYEDLAVGAPGDDVSGFLLGGVVNVLMGSANGLTDAGNQLWDQDSPNVLDQVEEHDAFGRTMRPADFNADGYPDIAIGSPGESVGAVDSAGGVSIIYGSANGLDALAGPGNQFFTQDTPMIKDVAERADLFGRHIGVGDFNADGYGDLAIGVVSEDVGTVTDAGAVNVLYGGANGLMTAGNQFWTQDTKHILGVAEAYDAMGRAVQGLDFNADGYSDLAIGVPGDTVEGLFAAGAVNVLSGSATGVTALGNFRWTLATPGIVGDAQAGSIFGAGLVGLAAGSCGKPSLCNE
jgi:FG-GAP repeat